MRIARLCFLFPLLAGCAIPDRDNAHDSANAPSAALRIVDSPLCDGEGPTVVSAPRGHCIILDATSTTDPQDPAELEYVYRWSLSSTAGFAVVEGSATTPFAILPSAFKATLPLDVPVYFQVTARDGGGSSLSDLAVVALTNAPPTAVLGPPRSFPVGGYPWALGAPFDVSFDGSNSYDPDGDTITYSWALGGTPIVAGGSASDTFVDAQLGTNEARVVATLRVSDGSLTSALASEFVTVRDPNVWVMRENDGYPLLLDPLRHERLDLIGNVSAQLLNLGDLPGEKLVVLGTWAGGGGNFFGVGVWPDIPTVTTGGPVMAVDRHALGVDPANQRVWSVGWSNADEELTAQAFAVDTSPLALTPEGASIVEPFNFPEALPYSSGVDGTGTLWVTWTLSTSMLGLRTTGEVERVVEPGFSFRAIAARPGTGEVWALAGPDFLNGRSGASRLYRIRGMADYDVIPLDGVDVDTIAWADSSEIWLTAANRGAFRVDATLIADGVDVQSATVFEVPEAPDAFFSNIAADPVTGAIWFADLETYSFVRVDLDGRISYFPELDIPLFVDDLGALWFHTNGVLRRGLAPSPDRILHRPSTFGRTLAPDSLDGGAWMASALPPSMIRFAEDGTVQQLHEDAVVDGVLADMPAISKFTLDPGNSSSGWAIAAGTLFEPTGISRVAFSSGLPSFTTILDETESAAIGVDDGAVFAAAEGAPLLWLVTASDTLRTLDADGTLTTVFVLPIGEDYPSGAVSLRTGEFCLATLDLALDQLHLRRFLANGTPSGSATIAVDPLREEEVKGVSISRGDGPGDFCWVATSIQGPTCPAVEDTLVRAFSMEPGLAVQRDLQIPNLVATSLSARTPSTFWLTGVQCISTGSENVAVRAENPAALLSAADIRISLPSGHYLTGGEAE